MAARKEKWTDDPVGWIGFPPPLLGETPIRLPVLGRWGEWFAIPKPAHVSLGKDPWSAEAVDLLAGINVQAARGKPELERLGVGPDGVGSIYKFYSSLAGVALLGSTPEAVAEARESYGSDGGEVIFQFLTDRHADENSLDCDLPLARHFNSQRVIVSHQTGKKCRTEFNWLESWGRFNWWEARTTLLRPHQILVHAQEVGLRVIGDAVYGRARPLVLGTQRSFRDRRSDLSERAWWSGPVAILRSMHLQVGDLRIEAAIRLPRRLERARRWLQEHVK